MRKLLITALLFATTLMYAAPKYGGVLVFGRSGDSVSLDPGHVTDGESFYASTQVYNTLVQFKNGTTIMEPGLATSWDISKDGLTYTFHLRHGVYFHPTKFYKKRDEFTADDVLFSLKRQYDKSAPFNKIGGAYRYWSAMNMSNIVKDVIKVNKFTVKVILKHPEAPFLSNMAMDFASILSKKYAMSLLKEGKADRLARYPVGTGPFVFKKWIKDDRIIFTANENYWGGKPYIKKLILKVITNSSVRAAELKVGSIQVMDFPNPAEIAQIAANPNVKLIKQEGLNVGYLALNEEKVPAFKDVRVRRAINYAIDKKAIVKAIYAGFGKVAYSPIPPTMWSYNKNTKQYNYDPAKAKKLLKEAGYSHLTFNIWAMPVARPYMPNARKVAEAIQAYLAKVGVKVKIITYDWGTYLSKTANLEADSCLLGWTGDNGDPDNFLDILLSAHAAQKPAQNRAAWKDKKFSALVAKAKVTTNMATRTKLYKEAQVVFGNQAPWVTIANSLVIEAVRKNVMNFKLDPMGKRRFNKVWFAK
ncbi:MAG: ABC transporter substrate-binding protein [Epsilonproteobacteria bacterium]|nr:ABC transporter substrate-binding protein [Campylobacterota bacterium]